MIEAIRLQKSFEHTQALNNMSLSLQAGGAYALLGGNGAGKSTLIKRIMGLIQTDSGTVRVAGHCAYLPEQPYLPDTMSPWQLLMFACAMQSAAKGDKKNQHAQQAAALLREVKLSEEVWHKRIAKFSKGMKQRTAIAYALAGNPNWLILDEPMSGLDAMGRSLVIEILQQRHGQGVGILMCSHLVTDIVKLCQTVVILVKGEVKEIVPINEQSIAQADALEQKLKYWSNDEIHD